MDQHVIDLCGAFSRGVIGRRLFLERLSLLCGSVSAGLALAELIVTDPAAAAMIAPDDPRLEVFEGEFQGPEGEIKAYLAKPQGAADFPAVVVIHEDRGLSPHIQDVARRLALEGFLALAPDFLSPLGGTPDDPDLARNMVRRLEGGETMGSAIAAVQVARGQAETKRRVGALGFGWGGSLTIQLAIADPNLQAAVAFYGRTPQLDQMAGIKASLLLHYAGLDERLNKGIPNFRKALEAVGVDYRIDLYKGVKGGFHDDTAAAQYDDQAAKLAWSRTIDFLKAKL